MLKKHVMFTVSNVFHNLCRAACSRPARGPRGAEILLLCFLFVGPLCAAEVTIEHEGLTLNANLDMAEGKSFQDGIVLILHAFLQHNKAEFVQSAQQALTENEQSSLAINLSLGIDNRHGFHYCTQPHRHIQDNAVAELSAWVAWLRSKGADRITLLSHSRGANQVMVYASENIDPEVKALVLLGPASGGTAPGKAAYMDRYGIDIEKVISFAQKQVTLGKGDELMKIDWLTCPQADTTPKSFLSYWANDKFNDFKSGITRVKVPTLLIVGSQDERQPNSAEILASVVDNQRTQLTIIEGAGHFFRDLNMDEAIEAAVEFIAENQ